MSHKPSRWDFSSEEINSLVYHLDITWLDKIATTKRYTRFADAEHLEDAFISLMQEELGYSMPELKRLDEKMQKRDGK